MNWGQRGWNKTRCRRRLGALPAGREVLARLQRVNCGMPALGKAFPAACLSCRILHPTSCLLASAECRWRVLCLFAAFVCTPQLASCMRAH